MSDLVDFAKSEFRHAGWMKDDGEYVSEEQGWVCADVLALLSTFSGQGTSGSSAPYVLDLFYDLARWKCIGPLTGDDAEWMEVSDGLYQNVRCFTVFKSDGQPYDIDGKIFWEWRRSKKDGEMFKLCFTNSESRIPIKFPYFPGHSEYVFRATEEFPYESGVQKVADVQSDLRSEAAEE